MMRLACVVAKALRPGLLETLRRFVMTSSNMQWHAMRGNDVQDTQRRHANGRVEGNAGMYNLDGRAQTCSDILALLARMSAHAGERIRSYHSIADHCRPLQSIADQYKPDIAISDVMSALRAHRPSLEVTLLAPSKGVNV